jgi:hypothetical protein
MDYETEIINGHTAIVRYIFPREELQVGSRWIGASGGIVTIEEIKIYPASDHETKHWYEIYYSWEEGGEKKTHHKDYFSFQCRYCLILENTYRAEQVWQAFKGELIVEPTEDMKQALSTTIRKVADRLCTDVGEIECPIEVVRQIADELEELK